MTKELFALLMASTLLIPLITPALGDDVTTGFGASKDAACISRQSQPEPSNQMSQTTSRA
jgi:hypothetical protein